MKRFRHPARTGIRELFVVKLFIYIVMISATVLANRLNCDTTTVCYPDQPQVATSNTYII